MNAVGECRFENLLTEPLEAIMVFAGVDTSMRNRNGDRVGNRQWKNLLERDVGT